MKDKLLLFCIKDSINRCESNKFFRMTEDRKKSLSFLASSTKSLNRSEKLVQIWTNQMILGPGSIRSLWRGFVKSKFVHIYSTIHGVPPSIFLFSLLESVRDILNLLVKELVIKMTDILWPFSYCNYYIKVKNALMSEIITEERYKIYKICDFLKKMAYRRRN